MTNVKLKLMFYLLNALLTADVVHSRPYSDDTYPQPHSQAYSSHSNSQTGNSNFQPYSGNSNSQPYGNSNLQTYSGNSDSQRYSGNSNSRYSNSDSKLHSYSDESDTRHDAYSQSLPAENSDFQHHSDASNSGFAPNPESQHTGNINSQASSAKAYDNTTDIVIKFPTNNTFSLPVDPNSDTLVVASDHDDETPEETNISSNSNMEAIVNAEQDRDEGISVNRGREQQNAPELNKDDAEIEKQLNISSTLLEDIIDSEADRDESITDILFKPESEFVDMPKFEFLIAAKINESEFRNDSENKNSSDLLKRLNDYVELVEVGKAMGGGNKSAYMLNITGHEVDNDLAPDTRFTDVQTWFLACFGTLLPLLVLLCAVLFIWCLCRRYIPGFCKKPSASSTTDSSEKPDTNHQQLKSPTVDGSGVDGESPPANGSIFTMTLKNNHLIVETEERNDITRNGRETKMKYSPDNDGIFVVEVQQSTAYRPASKAALNSSSPPRDPEIPANLALIHRVPEELERKEDSESSRFERDKALALSSTGLSISDLSMSSIGSHNISYSYGSQVGYEQGPFGYPIYAGYDVREDVPGIITDNSQEPLICKTPADPDKPVVTAAIFKQDSIIGSDALQGPGYCLEGSTDGPLLSDVQAREYSLHHLQEQKKIENGVAVPIPEKIESPKIALNRADSLPVRLENEKVPEEKPAMETIKEDVPPTTDMLKGKRGSLPIIRTEMYESMKDVILPTGSPKFEKLCNDSSLAESTFDSPPMITITEESESSKSEGTS